MECAERNLITRVRASGPSITRNRLTRVLTICHVKLTQSTSLEQKRFDLRSLSPALRNLWLLLVLIVIFFFQCHRCKSLYNNKPFLRGDRDNANPCIKCECNDHANSCIYNQTLDTNPNSRTVGGGGVCIDCQHNTTGRYCEMCKEMFYRESGKSVKARDVCTPCGCEGPGVQPGKLDCIKVGSV